MVARNLLPAIVAGVALGLAAAAGPALAADDGGTVLPVDATVDGQGYPELAQSWWRWLHRAPDDELPTRDPTGALCQRGQAGKVWFLAGIEGSGPVSRNCTVPAGRHLFVPVRVRLEHSMPGRRRDCDELREAATEGIDAPATLRVELDGRPLVPVRSTSADCFDAFADAAHDDTGPGEHAPGFTDGYWILLPPLPPGRHQLRVETRLLAKGGVPGRFGQQFSYELEVR